MAELTTVIKTRTDPITGEITPTAPYPIVRFNIPWTKAEEARFKTFLTQERSQGRFSPDFATLSFIKNGADGFIAIGALVEANRAVVLLEESISIEARYLSGYPTRI